MLSVLDLFSGIGGFSLGLHRAGGFTTAAFCEIEPYPRAVLAKNFPKVPIYDDVRTLTADRLRADGIAVDLICGGYPCQPFSTAGRRAGAEDDRHLWPEVHRLLDELRPAWFIGENVAGHISLGLDEVLSDLETLGYTARPFVIPACAVDAPHRRDRVWIVANTSHSRLHKRRQHDDAQVAGSQSGRMGRNGLSRWAEREVLADAAGQRQQGQGQPLQRFGEAAHGEGEANQSFAIGEPHIWPTESGIRRVAHGIPNRVDRLKALGNAIVPQIAEVIGRAILEAIEHANARQCDGRG